MKRVNLKIIGDVQGVNYRYIAMQKAKELNLFGWVKNAADGSVELCAEGEEQDLKKFSDWCRIGSRSSRVNRVMEKWDDIQRLGFNSFEITS